MEKILFATDKAMNEYITNNYQDCDISEVSGVIDEYCHDDSMRYIGDVSGECNGVCLEINGEPIAYLAYWEPAGDYCIKADGEVVKNADHLAMARELAKDIADDMDEKDPEVYIICPNGESLRWDER